MAFLRLNNGSDKGMEFEIVSDTTLLGRHPSCEVIVQDNAVSRRHASIDNKSGVYIIRDLESRNGTQVNNLDVMESQELCHGDIVQVCDTIFTFNLYQEAAEGKQSAPTQHESHIVAEFFDEASQASSIRQKVGVDSNYNKSDVSFSQSKLKILIEIIRALSQTLSLDDVIPKVLNCLFKIFPNADRAVVVLCDAEGKLGRHWAKDRKNRQSTLRVSRTIIQEAIKSKEAFLSEDAFSDQRIDLSQSIAGFQIRSVMCAPMLDADGNAIGCVQIDTLDPRNRFHEEELDLLATVAMQAGISVENARMHEQAMVQQAIDRDIELARVVQLGLLPKGPPKIEGLKFFNFYEAANKVGGDLFDYIELEDGRVAVVIADVAGHGIASALLMVKFSAEVRLALQKSAAKSVARINNAVIQLGLQRFITMLLLIIDPKTDRMSIVNAGHCLPVIRDDSGVKQICEEIAGLPVGIAPDFEYEEMELTLKPGTTLLLYTDGINEAINSDGEQFGHDRAIDIVAKVDNHADDIGQAVIKAVKDFEVESLENDDVCVVCIERN
ncbi:SpoIIE family protein phosphatase [Mariniblastus sp.]|nr:SpoIIE family protein phosphatase [Mariniblastus sp.]MDB4756780.1 SpoIIE family protein phosphatase [Mariniblastus sp.]